MGKKGGFWGGGYDPYSSVIIWATAMIRISLDSERPGQQSYAQFFQIFPPKIKLKIILNFFLNFTQNFGLVTS